MVHGKWMFYTDELDDVKKVISQVTGEEVILTEEDIYGFNIVVYEGETPVCCGKINMKNDEFVISRLCTVPEKRGMAFADLALRMMVRKAFDMGAERVKAIMPKEACTYFERLGFRDMELDGNTAIMTKYEDVGGCCKN